MHFTHGLLALIATTALTSALPNTPPKSKHINTQDIINALNGTYTLVNTSSTLNNVPIPDAAYGEVPVGILTYSRSGYMNATITATEPSLRPNLTFPFQPNDLDADWALVGKHSIGFSMGH
ncbi:hypothetical protein E8E11_009059 [Didymella keratinophila]|nr:hypothetical protein E8E11_009059 [Didymella keratinophila]